VKLVITIDTEEDDWSDYSRDDCAVTHTPEIASLQELFDEFGVRPTYLVTYPVVVSEEAATLLDSIQSTGRCEIGSHCHPWNTRPFEEEMNEKNSMLSNLPGELQYKKMLTLDTAIEERFGTKPVSFRCGRWGYNGDVAENLLKLGYRVDTSITAYTDWTMYQGPDFSEIEPRSFRFTADDIYREITDGPLLEVPATVGFLQNDFERSNSILRTIKNTPLKSMRLEGIMYRLNILNKVALSPELAGGREMIRLTKSLIRNEFKVINMFFHSPSLKKGLTPFVSSDDDEQRFFASIREFLAFTKGAGIESITLKEAAGLI
jgi:hypothetical protein